MNKTIAAIATTVGSSSISIIRVSGKKAIPIVGSIFKGKDLTKVLSHTINYGHIIEEGKVVDEVMVSVMKAPKTYTAEDVVEINCHGSILIPKKILGMLQDRGVRLAEAGEFTKRAFLNGRIDLSQAEAVMDLINAKSDLITKNSLNIISGRVAKTIKDMRASILDELAYIEASLDDPEHYPMQDYGKEILEKIKDIKNKIGKLIDISKNSSRLKNGINIAIVGLPNAGKSSLLNAIINKDRAIVTNVAGTTRDTIEEEVLVDDILLNLIDTAGIRDTDNIVEKIGVEKSIKSIEDAELVLYVVDSSQEVCEENLRLLELIKDKQMILILNKTDKNRSASIKVLEDIVKDKVDMSLIGEINLGKLIEKIKEYVYTGKIEVNDDMYIANDRQRLLLIEAAEAMGRTILSIEEGYAEDFIAIDLTEGYRLLGMIVGEEIEEDIIDKVFKDFCMGK